MDSLSSSDKSSPRHCNTALRSLAQMYPRPCLSKICTGEKSSHCYTKCSLEKTCSNSPANFFFFHTSPNKRFLYTVLALTLLQTFYFFHTFLPKNVYLILALTLICVLKLMERIKILLNHMVYIMITNSFFFRK